MPFKANTKFLVVRFEEYSMPNGQKAVELVPRSWIEETKNMTFCKYPSEKDYGQVDAWTKAEKEPEDEWTGYVVEILKEAKNHEQGLRRLKKSFNQAVIPSSTEDENFGVTANDQSVQEKLVVMSEAEIDKELQDIPAPPAPKKRRRTKRDNQLPSNNQDLLSSDEIADENEYNAEQITSTASVTESTYATKEDLVNLEKNIKKMFAKLRCNNQYDLRQFEQRLLSNAPVSTALGIPFRSNEMGVDFPLKSLESFQAFDATLKDNEDKQRIMTNWMSRIILGVQNHRQAITKIMTTIMSVAVQKEYSACGRVVANQPRKENFSATESYTIMCLEADL